MLNSPLKIYTNSSYIPNANICDIRDKVKNNVSNNAYCVSPTINLPDIRSVSFLGTSKDKASFVKFEKAAAACNINNLEDLRANIKEENFMGEGANSVVYKFDDPKLDKWVLKEDKNSFSNVSGQKLFKPTVDEFYGYNFGQEIAKAGDRYRILKKVEGIPHSIPNWSNTVNDKHNNGLATKEQSIEFLNSLNKIKDFPQESFDEYADELRMLTMEGYKQDCINPNNILIDYDKKTIRIIDFFHIDDSSHINSKYDLSCALLDLLLFKNHYENLEDDKEKQEQLIKSAKTIVKKCSKASKKAGISQQEGKFYRFLENVDKYFHEGHKDSYNSIKDLLGIKDESAI